MKGPFTSGLTSSATALGLLSAAVITFEIGLTRLFSFLLHYHFTFLVVSGAICGLGLGAMLAALWPPVENEARLRLQLGFLAWTCGLGLWAVTALLATFPTAGVFVLVPLATLPFILAGVFIARTFSSLHRQSQTLYFCDLAGAALATLWIIPCLEFFGGINTLLAAGLLAALAGVLVLWDGPSKRWFGAAAIGFLAALAALGLNLRAPVIQIPAAALKSADHKPLFRALGAQRNPGQILRTEWSAYARTDLVDRTGDTGLNLYTDGGAGSYMFRFAGQFGKVWFLRGETAFFPYYFGPAERVLILGPGGGADVLYALMTGWRHIDGVEINGAIVDIVRDYGDYNGHIYDLENVHIHIGDGRNFLERSATRYNLITLPLVYAQAADLAGNALVENFLFTQEAFKSYFDHLAADGRLALVVHTHALMLRVITTLASLAEEEGDDPTQYLDRVVVLNGTRGDPKGTEAFRPLILVKKTPYTRDELRHILKTAIALDLPPYFVPGFVERPPLAQLRTKGLPAFIRSTAYDIDPVTDERPFFYHLDPQLQGNLKTALWGAGIALFLFFLPGLRPGARQPRGTLPAPLTWAFFTAGLGCGFILVEIYLLQRLGLFLGQPVLTLCTALFALLFFSGIGSLAGARLALVRQPKGIAKMALLVATICLGFALLQALVLPAALHLPMGWRLGIALLLIAPMGAAMGICFPASLRLAGHSGLNAAPWMWGVNGIASVFGSVAALSLATQLGVSWVLYAGAGSYALAGAGLWLFSSPTDDQIDGEPVAIGWKKTGTFLLVVFLLWYAVLSFVAAGHWRATSNLAHKPPTAAKQVHPSTADINLKDHGF